MPTMKKRGPVMNETQRTELEEELKAEAKATLADFIDHQQRALTAAGKACEAWGSPSFESHLRVAGATSLAGFRRLAGNVADLAADCEAAGLCDRDASGDTADDARAGEPGGKRKRGLRLRVHVGAD